MIDTKDFNANAVLFFLMDSQIFILLLFDGQPNFQQVVLDIYSDPDLQRSCWVYVVLGVTGTKKKLVVLYSDILFNNHKYSFIYRYTCSGCTARASSCFCFLGTFFGKRGPVWSWYWFQDTLMGFL